MRAEELSGLKQHFGSRLWSWDTAIAARRLESGRSSLDWTASSYMIWAGLGWADQGG